MKLIEQSASLQHAFEQLMLENSYKTQTTFYLDFSIADAFGELAVLDTYEQAFTEWRNNIVYLTELSMVLNHKIWQHYHGKNDQLSKLYDLLWRKTDDYCINNLKDDELSYYLRVTD